MDAIIESLIALGPLGIVTAISIMANVAQWKQNNKNSEDRLEDWRKHSEAKMQSDQRQFELMVTLQGSINSLAELVKMGKLNG